VSFRALKTSSREKLRLATLVKPETTRPSHAWWMDRKRGTLF